MSAQLPPISAAVAVAAFERAGWIVIPNRGKSHIILGQPGNPILLSIPNHRELKRGLLRAQIRNAGLNVEQFMELVRQ